MSDQPVNPSLSVNLAADNVAQPSNTPSPAEENLIHRIFIGPEGLRPGWRLLIYILLTAACLKFAASIAHAFGLHAPKSEAEVTPWNVAWSRAAQFLIFLFTAYI